MTASHIKIDGRRIGSGCRTFVVAELSANHRQQYDEAVRLIRAAHECGADAVKLQTYAPETMTIEPDDHSAGDKSRVGQGLPWTGRRLVDLYAEAYMPWEWQPRLADEAHRLGMTLFSSPFDSTAVDFLEAMACPAYKIASFELVDLPLLQCVAATGKPVLLSTGMATWEELCEAVDTLRSSGCRELSILKCVSSYPAEPAEMNLRNIPCLVDRFRVPVGISDHTLGCEVGIAAVALGASIIEKHLTLSRSAGGPDSSFSLEPHEFRGLVQSVRTVEESLGSFEYAVSPRETSCRALRRSVYVVSDVAAGETMTAAHVRAMRPAAGIEPRFIPQIVGRRAIRALCRGTALSWDMLDGDAESGRRPAIPRRWLRLPC